MRASWHALHARLVTTSNRLTFLRDFRQIAAGHAALCGIADPAALLDRLHRAEGDPEDRNGLLRALVLAAQAPDDTAETATVLLLLAHLPGLDAAYGRLLRHVRDDPDGLASEIAARVTEGILRVVGDPDPHEGAVDGGPLVVR